MLGSSILGLAWTRSWCREQGRRALESSGKQSSVVWVGALCSQPASQQPFAEHYYCHDSGLPAASLRSTQFMLYLDQAGPCVCWGLSSRLRKAGHGHCSRGWEASVLPRRHMNTGLGDLRRRKDHTHLKIREDFLMETAFIPDPEGCVWFKNVETCGGRAF